jgi:hypothetical protein|tara:strand:- start:972 stop:1466 length:495 start_codon:yes stop_codon:yes gene_type:complete
MKIYNTKNIWQFKSSLWSIAGKLGIDLDMNQVSGNCHRVKLKLGTSKKYQRLGFSRNKDGSRKKVNAVCWHGYRDFLKELYLISGTFKVVTAQATYNNIEDFYNKFEATGNNNIGSMVDPLPYRKACNCERTNFVIVTEKELAANNYRLDPKFWINKKRRELIK